MAEASPPVEVWYYAVNGQRLGPLNRNQLQALLTTRQITPATSVWKAGMADWQAAEKVAELAESCAAAGNPAATDGPPPPPRTAASAAAALSPAQKRRRIGFLIAAGFAVISICLPWGYVYAAAGDVLTRSGLVIGAYFWESIVCLILGLAAVAAASLDLALPNSQQIRTITRWCHLGLFGALMFFALLGTLLPLADSHGYFGGSGAVIPIASVLVLAFSIAALVLAIIDCRGRS